MLSNVKDSAWEVRQVTWVSHYSTLPYDELSLFYVNYKINNGYNWDIPNSITLTVCAFPTILYYTINYIKVYIRFICAKYTLISGDVIAVVCTTTVPCRWWCLLSHSRSLLVFYIHKKNVFSRFLRRSKVLIIVSQTKCSYNSKT